MRFSKKICFLMVIVSLLFCGHGRASQSLEGTEQGKETCVVPDNLDPVTEKALASLTPGERKWYHRFQEGVPFFDGWKKITQMVVERFPKHEQEQKLAAMQALGLKIGYEWSRDNRVRKVDTDMLRAWGKDLRKAGAENHVQLAKVLYKIDSEMNSLLHRE